MKSLKELLAIAMIGEGLLALIYPQRYLLLWRLGPQSWREAVTTFVKRPLLTRIVAMIEAITGFWLAKQQIATWPKA